MAKNNSTPAERRRQLHAMARDAAEIDELLRELLRFFIQLQRMCKRSRRLGNRLYRLLKDEEKRQAELR